MILPYLLRLLCLCFASFFVLNFAAGLLVCISSKSAIRFAASRTPMRAARLLVGLRLLPFALAVLFVLGLCVPSYLWLEPTATSERVGLMCGLLGLFGAATWLNSLARTAQSLFVSLHHNRLCRFAGQEARLPGESSPVVLVENEAPLLAMAGLFRPRLLISRSVLQNLSAAELGAALAHEHAHRTSRDNLKRLLIQLAPDILPFLHPLRTLERTWSQFAEWAADDQATEGDSGRAVSLAAALVQVARIGRGPRLPFLSTSLLASDRDLSARVDRLLETLPVIATPTAQTPPALRTAGVLLVGCMAALLATPATLAVVHELLELLLR
jgi:beta-lactamase regulating signal transducer with metallopeptidase domain